MELIPENVQDYPRPPALESVPQTLRVEFGGQIIAETARGLRVLEIHHAPTYYLPLADVAEGVLLPAAGRSFCEWKGVAHYYDVRAGEISAPRAAWGYAAPERAFAALKDTVAFYVTEMDACWIGDQRATAQPGSFYGGWVTPNLTGIVKGGPGTEGW